VGDGDGDSDAVGDGDGVVADGEGVGVGVGTVNRRTTDPSAFFVWPSGLAGSCRATMFGVGQAALVSVPARMTWKPAASSSLRASE
jgi:hypothetical protein